MPGQAGVIRGGFCSFFMDYFWIFKHTPFFSLPPMFKIVIMFYFSPAPERMKFIKIKSRRKKVLRSDLDIVISEQMEDRKRIKKLEKKSW